MSKARRRVQIWRYSPITELKMMLLNLKTKRTTTKRNPNCIGKRASQLTKNRMRLVMRSKLNDKVRYVFGSHLLTTRLS